jgi:PAS domain S-box-containing protein
MMGLVGMSRDITERKRAEEALRQKVDEQAALYEASQVFLDEVGVQAILQKVCRLAVEHFGLRMAWVGLVDKDSFNVSPASICGFEKGYLQSIQVTWDDSPYGQGPIGTAIRTARPTVVNQIETDPTFAPWRWPALERGYRALASLPLYYVQEVLGVLNVYSAETEYFTPDRLQVLQSFANLAAVALRKARLYEQVERHTAELEQRVAERTAELTKINEQLQREIAERKQVETALRESEERYRTLFEQANDAIFLQTEDDQIIDVNQRACEMLGYTREELLTMTVPDLQAPEIRQGMGSVVKQELDKYGSTPFETTDIRRDGKRVIVEISLSRVTGRNGGLVLAIIRDITGRKRAEAELERLLAAEREQRLLAETLREVTLALTAQTSHEAVLDEILQQAQQLVPCNTANIMLLEEDNLRMARWKGYEVFGIGESISGLVLPLADFPLDTEVVQSRKALALPDVRQEPRWTAIDETAWIRSHITVPICQRDRVLGLLQLDSDAPGEFSAGDIQRLQPLASAAAIALENAHLYEQALQDAETKLVLLHEVNHRVKNNLAAIIGLLYAERSHASMKDKAAFQTMMRDLIGRVRGMATVHSLLSASEWTPLPLSELASRVIHASLQALPSDKHVFVDAPPSPALVTPKQANSLALVINELATNTVKYALSDQDTGRITVRISLEDGAFALEFRDNGPGYPPEVLQLERFNVGMHLVQAIVQRELRGEVTFHNDQGAVAIIRFESMAYAE